LGKQSIELSFDPLTAGAGFGDGIGKGFHMSLEIGVHELVKPEHPGPHGRSRLRLYLLFFTHSSDT
jgi:hypothetical protein